MMPPTCRYFDTNRLRRLVARSVAGAWVLLHRPESGVARARRTGATRVAGLSGRPARAALVGARHGLPARAAVSTPVLTVAALEWLRASLGVGGSGSRPGRAGVLGRAAVVHRVHALGGFRAGARALPIPGHGVRAAGHATAARIAGAPFGAHPARLVAPSLIRLADPRALAIAEALASLPALLVRHADSP